MTSNARFLAVALLSITATGCGKKDEPPAAVPPPSATPGMMATAAPLASASPGAVATMTPETPMMEPTTAPATRPPAAGAASPAAPQATPPAQPPATTAPAPAATAAPPVVTQPPATQPAVTQPAAPTRPAAQRPTGKIVLPAKLGAVTFDHEGHAGKRKIACSTCHHASKPQKPQAAENQRCRDCHTMPAAAPMKTSLQAAFHDPRGATGTCIDCHKKSVASGTPAPVKCLECHKKK